jgi:peptide/nickel transport system substrate-binding protein
MRRFRHLIALAVIAAGSYLVTTTSSAATTKPVLRFASATVPTNVNPAIDIDSYVLALAYASIIHVTPNGTPAPGLATSWGYIGSGNSTFQFTLRHGARFSDGSLVTAEAVKKWMIYFHGASGAFAKNIPYSSIQTVGQWHVIIHLSTATPNMQFLLAEPFESGFIGSPEALADPKQLDTSTDGAGPYMLDPSQTVPGDHYTFIPNPHFYDPSAVRFSKVIFSVITQPSTMLAAVETGQLDAGFGDLSTVKQAEADGLSVVTAPLGWVGMLLLDRGATTQNGQPNPLSKLAVRQALNYAVDRKAISSAFIGKYGAPTDEAPTLDGWSPKYANYYSYDPAKAKALLASAGYPHGFTLDALSQSFFGTLGDPFLEGMAKYFSAVGVTLNITPGPTLSGWLPEYLGPNYQATGFVEGPVISAFTTYNNWYGPTAYVKHHGWDDPVLDKLWAEGSRAKDPGVYAKEMMERITTQADEVIVTTSPSFWYVRKDIGGVAYSAATGYPYPTEWYPQS